MNTPISRAIAGMSLSGRYLLINLHFRRSAANACTANAFPD